MYELASSLGQPLSTILEMTEEEFHHWFVYYNLKNKRLEQNGASKREHTLPHGGKRQ